MIPQKNHFHRYVEYAVHILEHYNGAEPFHLYLKKYFSANKNHGSRDRKQITSLCYNYFRLGAAVNDSAGINGKLLLAAFLLTNISSPVLFSIIPKWEENSGADIYKKIQIAKDIFNVKKIFPFNEEVSDKINIDAFNFSFLIQPKLFIRIRPGKKEKIIPQLKRSEIHFEEINNQCLAFANTQKVSDVISIDKDAVIQDYSSQRIAELFPFMNDPLQKIKVWDCCAGSGGKSILAYDSLKNIQLTVSDSRKNILQNLHIRFSKSGIKNYKSFVADLSVETPSLHKTFFDLIIADVPCSGSGTWGRTPEQLHYFHPKKIKDYAALQRIIVSNTISHIPEEGYLLYITCSVFKKENEENVEFIQNELHLKLIRSDYLKGYEIQADTLFAALFQKK